MFAWLSIRRAHFSSAARCSITAKTCKRVASESPIRMQLRTARAEKVLRCRKFARNCCNRNLRFSRGSIGVDLAGRFAGTEQYTDSQGAYRVTTGRNWSEGSQDEAEDSKYT